MNPIKQYQKLIKTMVKADACVNRHTAQKLIKKADKISRKLKETDI
jgi:hypothetical protein